jgi:hypothetical protein
MTKRYLLVCGGTGKGLVDKRNLVGVDGVIQFDVVAEKLVVQQDNKTLNFAMPIPGDNILFNTEALTNKIEDLRRTRTSKLTNLELIKSSHGPMIAEYERLSALHAADLKLYVELKEILDSLSTPAQERRAAETKLASIETAVEAILKMKRELSSNNSPYLTLLHEIESLEKKIVFYQFVLRDLAPASLADGMAQMPIVGSSYFNRSVILEQIDQFFANMTAQNRPVANEPIEIFIISSMCGGTGQGISHHVGMRAAKYFRKTVPNASISVRFIRVGAWTYNKIGAALNFRTNTNAALAILHDAGLAYGQQVQNGDFDDFDSAPLNTDKALADFQFFYLETPDVGVDKALRMQDIEIACRAIMNEDLSQKFQIIMVNIGPIDWFKGVFVRVGYWANEVDLQATYRETLEQLRAKMSRLVTPNYRNLVDKLRYEIQPNSSLVSWQVERLVEQKDPSKAKSKLSTLNPGRYDEDSVVEYIKSQDFMTKWGKMSEFLQDYIGMQDKHGYTYDFRVGPQDPQASLDMVAFDQQIAPKYSVQYINNVYRAHDVRAMSLRLLAGGGTEKSIIERLFSQWNAMVPGMFDGNKTVDSKVRDNIKSFVETFVLVRMLTSVIEKSDALITDVRDWLAVMVDFIKKQQESMPAQAQVVLTSSAELTDLLDTKTWLSSIHDTLIGNLQSAMVVNNFKSAVVWGSRGLTSHGLRHVMGIPQQASSQQVVAELNSRAGRLMVDQKPEEAKWWQGQVYSIGAPGQFDFSYRVLPPLPPEELFDITSANDEYAKNHGFAPNYIQAPNAFTGLKILSVECVRSQRQLVPVMLAPLLNSLQIKDSDRNVEGYIQRLAGSSIGEPIYLTDEMNEQIGGGRVDLRKYFITVGE